MAHLPMSGNTKKKSSPGLETILDVLRERPYVDLHTGDVQMSHLRKVEKLVKPPDVGDPNGASPRGGEPAVTRGVEGRLHSIHKGGIPNGAPQSC